jgi:hypothetical protein
VSPEQRANIAAFYRALSRMLRMLREGHVGRWVVIHDGMIFGTWARYEDALDMGYRSFGLESPFLVQQIKADDPGLQWFERHEAGEQEYASWIARLTAFNWEDHLHTRRPVRVVFAPRAEHNGRCLLLGMQAHAGTHLDLVPLWLQGESDPYPDEWALGHVDYTEVLGRAWISSGDVRVVDREA